MPLKYSSNKYQIIPSSPSMQPSNPMNSDLKIGLFLLFVVCCLIYLHQDYSSLPITYFSFFTKNSEIIPTAKIKPGSKWIVVTSISSPTEDVKRLAAFKDWNLVVVADTKTPIDWNLEGVHFLSVEYQKTLPFSLISKLPYKSYTRKNIGYLYAISQGAEWIYDTDDDNKPFGLGLDQFDYEDIVSGIRYRVGNDGNESDIQRRLFNPYRFFGMDQMWPRGFPLEFIESHTNGNDSQVLCYKMKRAAVQQGLVHHDPDVDAVYRLLHADSKSGLNVKFNKFTPPITLSVGTYSPWNSQNSLFHKSAFHTLFLPTTVSFRTTDIWRSYIAQKILHLSGLTVSFTPTNAVQFRNAHDYLKDFKDEKQVYEDSGKIVKFLHNWKCANGTLESCIRTLTEDLVAENLWGQEDSDLMIMFLEDLKMLGLKFPDRFEDSDPYSPSTNESTRDVNCRRMSLEFNLVDPKQTEEEKNSELAQKKINYFEDLVEWCNASGYSNFTQPVSSPRKLIKEHNSSYVFRNEKDTVLVVVNNYPWKWGMGLIQRLYEPYFASVIFCGSYYPQNVASEDSDPLTSIISPLNYVHMNPAEMHRGYFGYHCVTLVKEMRLSNVKGYFHMADDSFFNIWQQIDYSRVHHLTGVTYSKDPHWWQDESGLNGAKRILAQMKNNTDPKLSRGWKQYEDGLRKYGYLKKNETAENQTVSGEGRSISDFFYIPTREIEYYSVLMRLFYENRFFLEIAVNRFLRSVNHQTSLSRDASYLWGNRGSWATVYNKNMVAMHPIKISQFKSPGEPRRRYCGSVLKIWSEIVFGGSQNYTTKKDSDKDFGNG